MRSEDAALDLVVVLLAVAAVLVLVAVVSVTLPEVVTPPLPLAVGTEVGRLEKFPPGKVLGAETPEVVPVGELPRVSILPGMGTRNQSLTLGLASPTAQISVHLGLY